MVPTRAMLPKMLFSALTLLATVSGPCSSADYTPCYDSPLTVQVTESVDGGTANGGDGGEGEFRCEPLCPSTNDGKPFAGCERSPTDGGAPTVTCHYQQLCGA